MLSNYSVHLHDPEFWSLLGLICNRPPGCPVRDLNVEADGVCPLTGAPAKPSVPASHHQAVAGVVPHSATRWRVRRTCQKIESTSYLYPV